MEIDEELNASKLQAALARPQDPSKLETCSTAFSSDCVAYGSAFPMAPPVDLSFGTEFLTVLNHSFLLLFALERTFENLTTCTGLMPQN